MVNGAKGNVCNRRTFPVPLEAMIGEVLCHGLIKRLSFPRHQCPSQAIRRSLASRLSGAFAVMIALEGGEKPPTKRKDWTGNNGGRKKEVMKPKKALQMQDQSLFQLLNALRAERRETRDT